MSSDNVDYTNEQLESIVVKLVKEAEPQGEELMRRIESEFPKPLKMDYECYLKPEHLRTNWKK